MSVLLSCSVVTDAQGLNIKGKVRQLERYFILLKLFLVYFEREH